MLKCILNYLRMKIICLIFHKKNEKTFKLVSTLNTSNMVLYNSNNEITKFSNVKEILKEYCDVRLSLYEKKKTI